MYIVLGGDGSGNIPWDASAVATIEWMEWAVYAVDGVCIVCVLLVSNACGCPTMVVVDICVLSLTMADDIGLLDSADDALCVATADETVNVADANTGSTVPAMGTVCCISDCVVSTDEEWVDS